MLIPTPSLRPFLVGLCSLSLLAADLPVKRITLYKHGIGFFERTGSVPAGEELRLDFKNTDMNDVLKSLTVSEADGAKVSGIRYDSNATLEQKLEKYPFAIGNSELLSTFLDRIKGAHLEAKVADKTLSGSILGARAIATGAEGSQRIQNEQVTLLLDSGDVTNVDIGAIVTMRLLDAHLQDQLKQYLQTLAEAKSKDKRSIYIDSTGSGARELQVSYIAPRPFGNLRIASVSTHPTLHSKAGPLWTTPPMRIGITYVFRSCRDGRFPLSASSIPRAMGIAK